MAPRLKKTRNSVVHGRLAKAQPVRLEDKVLMSLPKPLRDYLREEALANYNLRGLPNKIKLYGADAVLAAIKRGEALDTRRLYGDDHPQAWRA